MLYILVVFNLNIYTKYFSFFAGAYITPVECIDSIGVDSTFYSQAESIDAVRYFFHHSTKAKMVFKYKGELKRIVDVPITEDLGHPAIFDIHENNLPMFTLLVQFGTNLFDNTVSTYNFFI